VLLPREAGEVLTTHVPRFERRKVRMATDLLLYGVQLASELLDQPLGVGQVGLPRGRPVHGAPFARASSRVLCALAVASTSHRSVDNVLIGTPPASVRTTRRR
jgi:hypothetical protein